MESQTVPDSLAINAVVSRPFGVAVTAGSIQQTKHSSATRPPRVSRCPGGPIVTMQAIFSLIASAPARASQGARDALAGRPPPNLQGRRMPALLGDSLRHGVHIRPHAAPCISVASRRLDDPLTPAGLGSHPLPWRILLDAAIGRMPIEFPAPAVGGLSSWRPGDLPDHKSPWSYRRGYQTGSLSAGKNSRPRPPAGRDHSVKFN